MYAMKIGAYHYGIGSAIEIDGESAVFQNYANILNKLLTEYVTPPGAFKLRIFRECS